MLRSSLVTLFLPQQWQETPIALTLFMCTACLAARQFRLALKESHLHLDRSHLFAQDFLAHTEGELEDHKDNFHLKCWIT